MTEPEQDPRRWATVDDLPFRLALPLIVAFATLVFGSAGLLLWLGHPWTWDHLRLIGPIAGLVFFGATQPWWSSRALADPAVAQAIAAPDATRRLRRRARLITARWWTTLFAVVVFAPGAVLIGSLGTSSDAVLIRTQPHQDALIVAIHHHTLSGEDSIRVRIGGSDYDIQNVDNLAGHPHVGSYISVVVDPEDPSYVLGTDTDQGFWDTTWGAVIVAVGIAALAAIAGWGYAPASRGAARSVRRGTSTRGTVVAIEDPASGKSAMTFRLPDGRELRWALSVRPVRLPPVGTELEARGDFRVGGHAAAVYGRWVLWTARPLSEASG